MIYLDTNVIISYIDELDPNHDKAVELLSRIKGDRIVSRLTLVELTSVYSRANLPNPPALSLYSIRRVNAEIAEADFNNVLQTSLRLAELVRLRTLDLLHVAICKVVGAKTFATFDREIISKSNLIEKIGIKVISK